MAPGTLECCITTAIISPERSSVSQTEFHTHYTVTPHTQHIVFSALLSMFKSQHPTQGEGSGGEEEGEEKGEGKKRVGGEERKKYQYCPTQVSLMPLMLFKTF